MLHQHIGSWDADFVETQVAVIVGVHAQLGANLSNDHS